MFSISTSPTSAHASRRHMSSSRWYGDAYPSFGYPRPVKRPYALPPRPRRRAPSSTAASRTGRRRARRSRGRGSARRPSSRTMATARPPARTRAFWGLGWASSTRESACWSRGAPVSAKVDERGETSSARCDEHGRGMASGSADALDLDLSGARSERARRESRWPRARARGCRALEFWVAPRRRDITVGRGCGRSAGLRRRSPSRSSCLETARARRRARAPCEGRANTHARACCEDRRDDRPRRRRRAPARVPHRSRIAIER